MAKPPQLSVCPVYRTRHNQRTFNQQKPNSNLKTHLAGSLFNYSEDDFADIEKWEFLLIYSPFLHLFFTVIFIILCTVDVTVDSLISYE